MKSLALATVGTLLLTFSAPAATIRGLGQVTPEPITFSGLEGLKFQCDSPEHAVILLHKIASDMSPTATVPVTWQTVSIGGVDAPVLVRQGFSSILLAAKGSTTFAYMSTATDNLSGAFSGAAASLAGASFYDSKFRYPMYMDKFSSRGIGSWYGLGLYNVGENITDTFNFLRDHDLSVQPNGGGFLLKNLLPIIHQYDRPFHFAQWLDWTSDDTLLCPGGHRHAAGKDFGSVWAVTTAKSVSAGINCSPTGNWVFERIS
jgi:hypothetical protein